MPKFIPDNTPYIAGLLEATNDTIHHYPEIIVGYFTNHVEYTYDEIFSESDEPPEIYNTDLMTQLIKNMTWLGLSYRSEELAEVFVTGPLNHLEEKRIKYKSEGNGLYGDVNSELKLLDGEFYRLEVQLPDGRKYTNRTKIPEETRIEIPDSIFINLNEAKYDNGIPLERNKENYRIYYNDPPDTKLRLLQINMNVDREVLLMEPGEEFIFANRSNYLRSGTFYELSFSNLNTDSVKRTWIQELDKPKQKIWNSLDNWFRFSFFSEGIGNNFFPMVDFFATSEEWDKQIHTPLLDAIENRDTTYFFDVSTILKVGENGEVLPKEESDAIGFFAGYFSVYDRATIYPIRNFDLDSLLTVNGNN